MKKRIISILLSLCLVLPLLPTLAATATTAQKPWETESGWTVLTSAPSGHTLSGSADETAPNKYYLGSDVETTSIITVTGYVILDLNGYVLKLNSATYSGSSTGSVIQVGEYSGTIGHLTLQDSRANDITATHYYTVDSDTDLWKLCTETDCSHTHGTLTGGIITGGCIDTNNDYPGSGVYVAGTNSSFTMTGGSIIGCKTANGGGVYVAESGCTFEMKDGLIAGCTADSGGGVNVNDVNATFTMTGGTIRDCKADNKADALYIVYINNPDRGMYANGGDIYGTVLNNGKITNTSTEGKVTTFHDAVKNGSGGTIIGSVGASSEAALTSLLKIGATDIKLMDDITIARTLTVTGTVTLDLNGHVLKLDNAIYGGSTTGSVIKVGNSSTAGQLTLKDSDPTTVHKFTPNTDGLWVLDETNGAETVNGGVIIGGYEAPSGGGSGVYITGGSTFTMIGGSIIGCMAQYGGGVCVDPGCTFEMKNSLIAGCTATDGGGVYNEGIFTMNDGSITGNTANDGGGVYCSTYSTYDNGAVFNLCGGSISDNISTDHGGMNVYIGAKRGSNTVTMNANGGTVPDTVYNYGTITTVAGYSGTTFNGSVDNYINGTISGGTFYGTVSNIGDGAEGGTISGGTFNGTVINAGTITGGTFNGTVEDLGGTIDDSAKATVTFDSKGGSAVTEQKVLKGQKATAPNDPTREGYNFVGWYTDSTCKTAFDFSTAITESITLYAKWECAGHTGGKATCTEKAICEVCGEEYGEIDRAGHDWGEWSSNGDGKHTRVCGNDRSHVETENCSGGKATCTDKAVCIVCGNEYGSALGHDPINHNGQAATCTDNGWEAYVTCSRCDYTTYKEIPALGHDYGAWISNGNDTHSRICGNDRSHVETENCSGGKATCTKRAVCNICGEKYGNTNIKNHTGSKKWVIKNDKQHKQAWSCCCFVTVVLEDHEWKNGVCEECGYGCRHSGGKATCTEKAICEVCGEEYGDALGHDPINHNGQAPTCTDKGWEDYVTCSRCDYTTYKEIDALGHDEISHDAQDATCTEKGWYAYVTCSRCDYTTYKEIDALGHDEISHDAQDATCTDKGWYAYVTCSRCDYTTYKEIDALGHDEITHDAQDATCTDKGWYAYVTCSRCDYTTYKEIDALGHDEISHDAQDATCTEKGWEAYVTCSRCNYTTYKEIDALGHDPIHHNGQAATCTDKGWEAYVTCSRCDYTTYKEIDALGHDEITHDAQDATCTDKGWYAYVTCSRCDYTTYKEIDALGHDEITHDAQDATCTDKGWEAYVTCSRCDYTTYKEIDALGHDYKPNVTAPTCEEDGYTTYTCTGCGDSYTEDEVPALGHDYGAWTSNGNDTHSRVCGNDRSHVETKDCIGGKATCTDKAICDVCGKEYGKVDSTNHTGVEVWEHDSKTHVKKWNCCGAVTVAEAEHEFDDIGDCICGAREFIFGDADNDGVIDSTDIVLIKKYIANFDYETGISSIEVGLGADVNGDGKIDAKDVVLLKKYIANYDVETGKSSVTLGPTK